MSTGYGLSANARGIACIMVGIALLSLNDAITKWLTAGYPVGQVLFYRGLFSLLPLLWLVWRWGGVAIFRVRDYKNQAIRSAFVATSSFLFVMSLNYLPLADTIAIVFAGPIFVAILSRPMLGERVGFRRWAAVALGFVGILVMVRPFGGGVGWLALFPLSACLAGALRDIYTRRISVTESTPSQFAIAMLAMTLAGLATLPLGWRAPPMMDVGLLGLAGIVVALSQYLMIEALRLAEASLVSPFKYTGMIWAVLYGFLIWGDLPDLWVIGGCGLVIASGLFMVRAEGRG
jgi:drug/metabolite transporter (DMT)-like permease